MLHTVSLLELGINLLTMRSFFINVHSLKMLLISIRPISPMTPDPCINPMTLLLTERNDQCILLTAFVWYCHKLEDINFIRCVSQNVVINFMFKKLLDKCYVLML